MRRKSDDPAGGIKPNVRIGIALFVLIWAGIGLTWYLRRTVPLDERAAAVLEDMLSADGGGLMNVAFEEEIEANQLNATKLRRLYSELILPRINSLEMDAQVIAADNGGQGTASRELRAASGFQFPMSAEVYPVENGVRSGVLVPLYYAWIVEYFAETGESFSLHRRNVAVLRGLRKDKKTLQEIGITHLTSLDVIAGEVTMMEITKMESDYQLWVDDGARDQSKVPTPTT